MSAQSPTPVRILGTPSQELQIDWNTGESFKIRYSDLRFLCPCAGCVDEKTGRRTLKRDTIPEDIHPTAVQTVGRYAIQVSWSDGHSTGMYHFDRLYDEFG